VIEVNRKILLTVVALAAVLLATPYIGTVYATQPTAVSGSFDYTFEVTGMREADGNVFLYAAEDEVWIGDFEGTSQAVFRVGMFRSGFWNVWLRSTFTGTVLGKSGTLVIQLVGKKPGGEDWYGQWVILEGTGELADLRGRGTWWGPGAGPVSPNIEYMGQVHFD